MSSDASASPPQFSTEQAARLLSRDLSNLVKKVVSGKTLSTSERALVSAAAESRDLESGIAWASNQVELANALGVHRSTIRIWRKEPGSPVPATNGRHNVELWKGWMHANGKEANKNPSPEKRELEVRRLALHCEKLQAEIENLKREFAPTSEAQATLKSLIAEAIDAGKKMPATLAPSLSGKTVADLELELRAWWDGYCLALHVGGGNRTSVSK